MSTEGMSNYDAALKLVNDTGSMIVDNAESGDTIGEDVEALTGLALVSAVLAVADELRRLRTALDNQS